MEQQTITRSELATMRFAATRAPHLQVGDVMALDGPLGAGKSVFARGLIRALVGNTRLIVPSPTFTLLQTYETSKGPLWHFDLWRLQDPQDLWEIGFAEALTQAITLIEWPERAGNLLPAHSLRIAIEPLAQAKHRRITYPLGCRQST